MFFSLKKESYLYAYVYACLYSILWNLSVGVQVHMGMKVCGVPCISRYFHRG